MEILNTIPGSPDGFQTFLSVCIVAFGILFLLASASAIHGREYSAGIGVGIFGIALLILSYHAYQDARTPSPDLYEVRISDFNEVYRSGYEIVEQRSEIYVVKKTEVGE